MNLIESFSFFALFENETPNNSRRTVPQAKSKADKRRSTLSKWDSPTLTSTQVKYAAFDAWGVREIYLSLCRSVVSLELCSCKSCTRISQIGGHLRGISKTCSCERCGFSTLSEADVLAHLSNRCEKAPESTSITVPFCVTCQTAFKKKEDLIWHERHEKHGRRRLECELCGEVFTNSDSKTKTSKHREHKCNTLLSCVPMIQVESSVSIKCDQCESTFASKLHLQMHVLWHATELLNEEIKLAVFDKLQISALQDIPSKTSIPV